MRADEERAWLEMLRAQPWRRQAAAPHAPPAPHPPTPPPGEQLLPTAAPLRRRQVVSDHGLRSARHSSPALALATPTSDCISSAAMRFLSRSPPHIPPLPREDRRQDARLPSYGAPLPSLRGWAAPAPPPPPRPYALDSASTRLGALAPFATRFSIASDSDATVPSSAGSTPTGESLRSVHVDRAPPPPAWPLLRAEPRAPSLCGSSPESSLRHHDPQASLLPPSPTKPPSTKRPRAHAPGSRAERTSTAALDARAPAGAGESTPDPPSDEKPKRKKKKRTPRVCTTPGCDKLVVDRGVCIRHGGGKRCNVEGCTCRAQNKGLCWKHGGYTICRIDGCDKRAKSRGMCWSHGGGTQCKTDGCEKIAVSRGRCWAHGGGKRCKIPECQKPAALRMDDYCAEHHAQHRQLPVLGTSRRLGLDPRHLLDDLQETSPHSWYEYRRQ